MIKILGISGTPRKGGNSDILLKHVLAGAGNAGAEIEAIHLRDYQFQGCIGCEKCRKAIIASIGEQNNFEEGSGFAPDTMRIPIEDLGFDVVAELPALGVFGKGRISQQVLEKAEDLGSELAKQLRGA